MAKKIPAGAPVSPENLWGRPLPRLPGKTTERKTEEKGTRMRNEDDELDDDVDAELTEDDAEPELENEEDDAVLDEDTDADESDDETPFDEEGPVAETAAESDDTDDDEDDEDDDEDDEDEDDVEDSADSAVDAADPKPRGRKPRTHAKVGTMAEKKTLSDHVRDEIAARKRSGDSLRGVDIVAALAKRKITVSPAQVSQLLKKEGVSSKSRGGRKKAEPAAAAGGEPRSRIAGRGKNAVVTPTAAGLPMPQLRAAREFVDACGSVDDAEQTLALFKSLVPVVTN